MRLHWLAFLAPGLLLAAAPAVAAGGTDQEGLQGTWALVSVEVNQQTISIESMKAASPVRAARLVVQGQRYTFHLGEKPLEMVYQLDPDKSPKEIDLTVGRGPNEGKVFRGIYRLEGDTFTICRHVEPGKDRPTAFGTRPGSGLMLVTWKRARP
jgi:uncharacterized protein (TIGR03067 family)